MEKTNLPKHIKPRELAYPNSELISGIEWQGPSVRYPGSGTDMHWWTWGADNSLYMVDDDGGNFGLEPGWKHLLQATGNPPRHWVREISQFPGLELPGPETDDTGEERVFNDEYNRKNTRYICGIVAIGSRLYVTVYDYDEEDPSKERSFMDIYAKQAGVVGFIYSDDQGKTWQNIPSKHQPDKDHPYFFGPNFAGAQFVGFGPGYTEVPENLAGYAYMVSNDSNWASGDHAYLARVPLDRVLNRSDWEFYAGEGEGLLETEPVWTHSEKDAKPILTDLGHVGHPDMTYNKPLGRFLLSIFSDGEPHTLDRNPTVARRIWHRRSELQIYESPTPWGPWRVVYNDPAWEAPNHVPYLPHIPSKWLSQDGMSGTLLFSGDYTLNGPTPPYATDSYYGFMTRSFRFLPAPVLQKDRDFLAAMPSDLQFVSVG